MLDFITWKVNPVAFTIPLVGREVRWYGILYALAFALSAYGVYRIWKKENLNEAWYDKLFIYVLVSLIIGARLGHCLFYDPVYYLSDPIRILEIWQGGLASHGGAIGILIGVYLYSKRVTHKPMMWTLDRLVVPVGFSAAFIRLGNLMNHEIYGHATDLPWGFRFVANVEEWMRGAVPIYTPPSHPTQIYEALCYTFTALVCMWLYWKKGATKRSGLIFGTFLIGAFLSRFFMEYCKNDQEAFEQSMILNMGQILSIPFIIAGVYFVWHSLKSGKKELNK